MACILNGGELTLSGDVGDDWFGDGFSHSDVVVALAQVDDSAALVIHLNSGGGYASEGAAIHALLSRRAGKTDIIVDGVAASAASLIAMAGDTVTMSAGSVMMIHDPANISIGNSDDHAKSIEYLEALATSYARVYAGKSGKSADECRAIMKAERWYAPDEAVSEGFADATSNTEAKAFAAFDYRAYAHAPQRLKALASKKNWRLPDASAAAKSAAQPRQQEEKSMTDKERADQLAAEIAELKAQMKSSKDADATAAMQEELEALRAEKAARENTDAIMALEETKGREPQAKALAEAGVAAAVAKGILAASAKAGEEEREPTRLNGQGLTGGGKPSAKGDKSVLADAVARTNKRR
ncbi:head maturation protease, ClpP-related [Tianweitania sediminis]|uniref:ATP-dependent Clp protease proteolytic subunit n=1 Tax=Tianweitania sediminis TaxID=1502156 RepID=A0A8J7R696_9HYPH|nr:head maturation protease, ClpP-related [Tianweitania sediminis]MBP0440680.1 Clp protease ClpP [Tianweitania sediminis]